MYKKIIILAGLMIPAMAMADRPAMSERYDEPDQAQPSAIEQPEQAVVVVEEAGTEDVIVEDVVVEQVRGDVLEMQPGDTIVISPLDFPRRGMSMDKVQNELGHPAEISPAVGEPPITSWTYPDRVVFFEYSRVIHVVEKR
jgi:hypothetical protein